MSYEQRTLWPEDDYQRLTSLLKSVKTQGLEIITPVIALTRSLKSAVWIPSCPDYDPELALLRWPKWINRSHFRARPKNPKLFWIEGIIEFIPEDWSLVKGHTAIVWATQEFLAVFNPGVDKPRRRSDLGSPHLLRQTVYTILSSDAFKARKVPVYYKSSELVVDECRERCWLEVLNLSASKLILGNLSSLGYEFLD